MRTDGITFIIPNWNHELVLPRSIRSALRAGELLEGHGLGIEVLVVDDASRDGSAVLLRQLEALYYDRGVRAVVLEDNVGVQAARNLALTRAGYRYVVFMDADNEVVPENIHHFYRAICETEAASVYGNLLIYGPGGMDMCSHESFSPRMYRMNYIDTFSMCDACQLLDAKPYWTDRRTPWGDWELYLHLAVAGRRLVHVPMVFGLYYRNRLSMLEESTPDSPDLRAFQRIYHQFPEIRDDFHLNTLHLRYHPDLGFL